MKDTSIMLGASYNGRRRNRKRIITIVAVLVVILIFILQGPKWTLNIFKDLEDIVIGRVQYEPVVEDVIATSNWPKERAAKWNICRGPNTNCPPNQTNYLNKVVNSISNKISGSQSKIPKIIHQMSATNKISSAYKPYVKSWTDNHKSWSYMFWTDKDIENLIKTHYSQYMPMYHNYPYNIQRSDMARLLILHRYGGVYVDLDYKSLKPLDPILENEVCVLTHEPKLQTLILFHEEKVISNAFIACAEKHPLLEMAINTLSNSRKVIEKMRGNFLLKHDGRWSNYVTGPFVISRAYDHYMAPMFHCCRKEADFGLKVVSANTLSPLWDDQQTDFFIRKCKNLDNENYPHAVLVVLKEECRRFREQEYRQVVPSGALATHDWLHLGYSNKQKSEDYITVESSPIPDDKL